MAGFNPLVTPEIVVTPADELIPGAATAVPGATADVAGAFDAAGGGAAGLGGIGLASLVNLLAPSFFAGTPGASPAQITANDAAQAAAAGFTGPNAVQNWQNAQLAAVGVSSPQNRVASLLGLTSPAAAAGPTALSPAGQITQNFAALGGQYAAPGGVPATNAPTPIAGSPLAAARPISIGGGTTPTGPAPQAAPANVSLPSDTAAPGTTPGPLNASLTSPFANVPAATPGQIPASTANQLAFGGGEFAPSEASLPGSTLTETAALNPPLSGTPTGVTGTPAATAGATGLGQYEGNFGTAANPPNPLPGSSGVGSFFSNNAGLLGLLGASVGGQLLAPQISKALGTSNVLGSAPLQGAATQAAQTAGTQTQIGTNLETPLETGTLPAPQQAQLDQATTAAIAAVKGKYASLGMSGSTSEQSAIDAVNQEALNVKAEIEGQLFTSGTQALQTATNNLGLEGNIYTTLLNAGLQQDEQLSNAISGFANALALGTAVRGIPGLTSSGAVTASA